MSKYKRIFKERKMDVYRATVVLQRKPALPNELNMNPKLRQDLEVLAYSMKAAKLAFEEYAEHEESTVINIFGWEIV